MIRTARCLLVITTLVLLVVLQSAAAKSYEYKTGKLVDVSADERVDEGSTIMHAVYQVQVGDLVYFARGERMRRHSGDPAHGLIVGDEVQVAVDGDELILRRPDNKEIKAKIIRRQRAEPK